MNYSINSVLIVGAGMAGLMLAASLPEHGPRLTLVDKEASPGGRLATRRIGAGRADYGAQFFTTRSPEFSAWNEKWLRQGLVHEWSTGWSDGSIGETTLDGHPRYAVRDGMNALARRLASEIVASGAVLHTRVRLEAISRTATGWWACSDDGRVYTADALVLTCPVPQSLALLQLGSVALSPHDLARLQSVRYAPCLCAMFVLEGRINLAETGALQQPNEPITWIADNQHKGVSPDALVVTVHASPEFSESHFLSSDDTTLAMLQDAIIPYFEPGTRVVEVQMKRWRYARPTAVFAEPYLKATGLPPLYFAGDAFISPRVEGAALSGMAVARAISSLLPASSHARQSDSLVATGLDFHRIGG